MADSWGHKITISIYVEGGDEARAAKWAEMAAKGAQRELHETYNPVLDHVGASASPVQEKPEDQDA